MDNSLLAVRDINHKYIVVDGKAIDSIVAPESKIMIENFINEALEK